MESNIFNYFCILSFVSFAYVTGVDSETSKVSFIPTHYNLHIITDESHFKGDDTSKMKFEGVVTVKFRMIKPQDFDDDFEIVLNANPEMAITQCLLEGANESEDYSPISSCKCNLLKDKLYINCTKDVKFDEFKLIVSYTSPFGNDMTGFYRCSYKDSSNNTRWLLTTHFEPIYARNAFPCFDHPSLKAHFEIQITVPKNIKTVLSNTAKLHEPTPELNATTFYFKRTEIPMSTYLVAFTASEFTATKPAVFESEYNKDKFPERELITYGRDDIISKGDADLAQKVGIMAINDLTKYLGIGYAYEKMDFVGIPNFFAQAMENWGHISFRENALFFNKQKSSAIDQQFVVTTITHELVHQWFGNLVSLESWDYIWLNEAFANYFQYKISNNYKISKSWNLMLQILVKEVHLKAFEIDGLNSSKPLSSKITDESLILPAFNDIPYAKGVAVLRMWDHEFKDKFQTSLQKYIDDRKENITNPSWLFEAFKNHANMSEETFKTWTEQPGYPVVEVKKKNGSYFLTQSRFFWENISTDAKWRIPITISTGCSKEFDTSPSLWLHKDPLKIDVDEKCKWIIVNNQQAGYYRVNYDNENWNALSKALLDKYSDIHELNRAQIINDVFSLARSLQKDYVDYNTALSLTKFLKNDQSYFVWKTALNTFDFLQAKLYKESVYVDFKKYILSLLTPHFKNLDSIATEYLENLKNVEIARWACALDYEPCVKQAQKLHSDSSYQKFPDTQEIVLCTMVRNNQKVWDLIFDKYKTEKDSALKNMYISVLGCTKSVTQAEITQTRLYNYADYKRRNYLNIYYKVNVMTEKGRPDSIKPHGWLLNKTLEADSGIPKQDQIYILTAVYNGNPANVETAFEFVKRNYKRISTEYGGINPLGKALVGIAKKLTTKEQLKQMEILANKIAEISEAKPTRESVESAKKFARGNVEWAQKKMVQFRKYFNSGSLLSYSITLLIFCILSVFQF